MQSQESKPKSVLILVQNLPVPFDRRVWMEATTLQQSGYQVNVVCPNSDKHPKLRETLEGVNIYRFPMRWEGRGIAGMLLEYAWSLLWMTVLTLAISLRKPIRVTHICNPPDLLFLATWPARLIRRSRLIFDQHDLGPELWEAKGHSLQGFFGRAIILAESITYKMADVVIATNESYKHIAMTRGGKSADNVFVVRSAPRRDFAIENPLPAREISTDAKLVYLGTMGDQEGIDLLLDALAQIIESAPNVRFHLDLIGDGPERSSLESYAKKIGVSANCTFHGRVSDADLRRLVSEADLAVNPDRPSKMNNLSSMNKIVEYMALGVPIVQFECLEGGRTAAEAAFAVQGTDSSSLAAGILHAISDPNQRQAMKDSTAIRFPKVLCWEIQEHLLLKSYSRAEQG